jgi:hypothetical protein
MKTVTKKDWQDFINTLTTITEQSARLVSKARGAGVNSVPAGEYKEMLIRFEKAATAFLGEKRRLLESREAFFNRVAELCSRPDEMLATMIRNGIQLRV